MMSLLTVAKAQKKLAAHARTKRLSMGLTQEGIATRSGVSVSTLRKFERTGIISLESFLKLMMVLSDLEGFVEAAQPHDFEFSSIDEVLDKTIRIPKKGWRK